MATVPDRKFLSEFAVSLFTGRWLLLSASELASGGEMGPEGAEIAERCHIYLICRRPNCSFDPATFLWDGTRIAGNIVYRVEGVPTTIPFSIPFNLVDGAIGIRISSYPHREVETFGPTSEVVRRIPADALSFNVAGDARLRMLEVLYVGQAYADGKRTAIDRLRAHATLQKILADTSHAMPDDQIQLLTFEYLPYKVITMVDGIDKKAIRDARDAQRISSIFDNPLTEHQQICLAEAGLIRYFQPKYNEIYKDSFPAADQKLLDQCYKLDFSAVIVEIDTSDVDLALYSERIAPNSHHTAQFDLVDPATRRSFFTFVDKEGKAVTLPDIIPPSRI